MVAFCASVAALMLLPAAAAGPALMLACLFTPLLVLDSGLARAMGMAGIAALLVALHLGLALHHRLPVDLEGTDLMLEGRVSGLVDSTSGRARFVVRPARIDPWPSAVPLPRQVRLSAYGRLPTPAAGETWSWSVRLKRPRGLANPQRFDYEAWLAGAGVDATGYVRQEPAAERILPGRGLAHWRAALGQRIAVAAGDGAGGAVLRALVVGDRRGFDDTLWSRFRATGTSHLVAISGLHVGLAAGLGALLGRLAGALFPSLLARWPRRVLMVPPGLLCAAVYAALAGFALPTVRALIMLAVVAVALLFRWRPAGARVLLLAATAVLAVDPWAVLSPGFWLSFGAVALLVLAFTGGRGSGRAGRLGGLIRAQWMIGVGLAPLTWLFFGQVSWLGLPVNLFAIPLFSLLLVPAALCATALLLLSPGLGEWALATVGLALDAFVAVLGWLARAAPALTGEVAASSLAGTPAWVAGVIAAVVLAGGWRSRLLTVGFVAGLWLAGGFGVTRPPAGALRMTVFEVGQGTAVLVEVDGRRLLYDTGPSWGGDSNAARFSVVPHLREAGVRVLDRVVVSHADNDHVGGLDEIMAHFEVEDLVSGEALGGYSGQRRCLAGSGWTWGRARFVWLWPTTGADVEGNDASCVLAIAYAGRRLLLTGDVESGVERGLVEDGLSRADLVVVPHHGSDSSSTPAFVEALSPALAVVPAGYGNAWGFPRPDVLKRYRRAGAAVFRTDRDGAVIVTVEASGRMQARSWRHQRRRLFHDAGARGDFPSGLQGPAETWQYVR